MVYVLNKSVHLYLQVVLLNIMPYAHLNINTVNLSQHTLILVFENCIVS